MKKNKYTQLYIRNKILIIILFLVITSFLNLSCELKDGYDFLKLSERAENSGHSNISAILLIIGGVLIFSFLAKTVEFINNHKEFVVLIIILLFVSLIYLLYKANEAGITIQDL